jgi:hypothetical protein
VQDIVDPDKNADQIGLFIPAIDLQARVKVYDAIARDPAVQNRIAQGILSQKIPRREDNVATAERIGIALPTRMPRIGHAIAKKQNSHSLFSLIFIKVLLLFD